MKFIRHIKEVMRFMALPKEQRRITFYCEGKNYWPHLEGLLKTVLADSDIGVCYISSNDNDPGLKLQHNNLQCFKTDEGFVRNWLFENIETELMVMTMPDLHQFQVKRSKHKVHYVYVQHSLVSLHMIYRKGAFDHYDTIFCAGPHHKKEIRAMEEHYKLAAKNVEEHGYARLDAIREQAEKDKANNKSKQKHVLIAPSWGPHCTIESGVGEKITTQLLDAGYTVTLRPHPQTLKFAKDKINTIVQQHKNNKNFNFEANVAGQQSLHESDIMISDWSGAALDYAFGLGKPVVFVDVPRKINNPDYQEIDIEPFEVSIRTKIGTIMQADEDCVAKIEAMEPIEMNDNYYYKNANSRGSNTLLKILENLNS